MAVRTRPTSWGIAMTIAGAVALTSCTGGSDPTPTTTSGSSSPVATMSAPTTSTSSSDPAVTATLRERQMGYLSVSHPLAGEEVQQWSLWRRLVQNGVGMMAPVL